MSVILNPERPVDLSVILNPDRMVEFSVILNPERTVECSAILNPDRLVDVGGQKSERRKWIHCFEASVTRDCIIGLAARGKIN